MTPITAKSFNRLPFVLACVLALFAGFSFADEAPPNNGYQPVTSADHDVDPAILALMVTPLSKQELEAEAEAWRKLIHRQATRLSREEIRTKTQDGESQAGEDKKTELAESAAELRIQLNSLIKRADIVLDELEKKGGDPGELRTYFKAVSGVQVDIADTNTAWVALTTWLKSSEGGVMMLISFIKFMLALIVVYGISVIAGRITDSITHNTHITVLLKNFVRVAVRRTVLIVGFIVSLTILDINVGPVLALIGAAGLVVGLALQSTLSNFASGVLILIYRPFDVDDVINVGGVAGKVHSMTLLSTTIKTLDNQHIVVPNNNVWGDTITNITGSQTRRVDMVFGISYDDDFDKAKTILKDILDKHPKVLDEPKSVVRVHELADSSVNLVCRPWVKTEDYWDVHWDVTEGAKRAFDEQGITIPFPQRDVHFYPSEQPDAADK